MTLSKSLKALFIGLVLAALYLQVCYLYVIANNTKRIYEDASYMACRPAAEGELVVCAVSR